MKDAKGHGSDPRGGAKPAAHQAGTDAATSGWSGAGEAYHGTLKKNLGSILKNGITPTRIEPYTPKVYIAPDAFTAARFAGSKNGDAERVVLKVSVPPSHRDKFQNYSFSEATAGALTGNVRIRPEWIKAWAPVKPGTWDLGEWRGKRK